MSSARPSDAPSPGASENPPGAGPGTDGLGSELSLVSLLRMRGAPLLGALEAHFPGSREQADAAASYAFAAAVELGLDRGGAELILEVAKLHDIGRVYVPAEVLAKPAWSRTREEAVEVESHHDRGAQLAAGAGLPDQVCDWIRLGAERFDGGGPNGLAGEAIPLQARISRAAYACYAALVDSRARQPSHGAIRGPADALRGSAGRELDPRVVEALASLLERIGPAG